MTTLVALENSTCSRCHSRMLRALRDREHVQRVRSDFAAGCLVIEHDEDPEVLVSLISAAGRGVAIAANGERVMVPVDAVQTVECRER